MERNNESKDVIKIGVFGVKRGRNLIDCLRMMKEVHITAICERDESAINDVRNNLPENTKIYTDYDEFICSGLDGVILCNYFHEHADAAIKAFEAGVAVLSETTAAVTLGDCVRLVEKCEENNGIYMLAANCPYLRSVHAMKQRIKAGKTGKVYYGEAEYLHALDAPAPDVPAENKSENLQNNLNNLHWRKIMPVNMYNMHSLGPLMYATDSVPLTVSCKWITAPELTVKQGKIKDQINSIVITEMSNGAVYNTTGVAGYGPSCKWYRLNCQNEALESVRYDWRGEQLLVVSGLDRRELTYPSERDAGLVTDDDDINMADVAKATHGGIDYYVIYHFIKTLKKEEVPFFDVYRSAALAAVGILGVYSALSNSVELKVPDFTKKEDRDKVRNDFRSPFAERNSKWWIPCRLDEKDKFVLELD